MKRFLLMTTTEHSVTTSRHDTAEARGNTLRAVSEFTPLESLRDVFFIDLAENGHPTSYRPDLEQFQA